MSEEIIELPSFNEQLRALKKGDSLSRVRRFDIDRCEAEEIQDTLQTTRRNINAAVSRIREKTGNNFRVESGTMISSNHDAIFAVVAVTRL